MFGKTKSYSCGRVTANPEANKVLKEFKYKKQSFYIFF